MKAPSKARIAVPLPGIRAAADELRGGHALELRSQDGARAMAGTGVLKTDQAAALLRSMLASGPRNAAEILATAKGANVQKRTIQLAATKLGVKRTKAGGSGVGWTWELPAFSEAPDSSEPDRSATDKVPTRCKIVGATGDPKETPRVEPPSTDVIERAKVIAGRLSKLEERRTRIRSRIHWQDPRIQAWAAAGVRDYQLREAYDLAASDPDWHGPLTASILARFVDIVIADEGAMS